MKCSDRAKFVPGSAPVGRYSEHRRNKVGVRSHLIRGFLNLHIHDVGIGRHHLVANLNSGLQTDAGLLCRNHHV